MRDLMREMIAATKEVTGKDAISADDLTNTFTGAGFSEKEAIDLINKANMERVIRVTFSLSARTAEDPNAGDTIVTLL